MATTIYKFQSDLKGLQQLNKGLKEAKRNLDALKRGTKEYAAASKNVGGMTKSLKNNTNALKQTRTAANQLNNSGRGLMTTFKGASVAIISAFAFRAIMSGMRGLVTIFAKFESQMAAVKAISGASDEQFQELVKSAKKLGETTVFTASEVANLQEELSRLGFAAPQIIAMQQAVLNLAAATGESLAKAAEVAGSQINAFGLEAEQAVRVTDVMGFSFANSALNLERFTQSMKFVAPVAKTAGFTIEETSSMLMTLADNGIHGSIAGNALKNIFLRLGDANSKLNKSLDGTVQGLPQLIKEMERMNAETFGLTEATDLLDKRSAPAFLTLLRNIEGLKDASSDINSVEGDISRMADVRLDTLQGDFTLLKSATEGLGLAVGESFNFELRKAIHGLTEFVRSIASSKKAIAIIKTTIFALIGAFKVFMLRLAALKVLQLATTISTLRAGFAWKRYLVSIRMARTGTTLFTRSLQGLRAMIASTGVGLLVVAVGALAAAFMSGSDETEKATFELEKLNEAFVTSIRQTLILNEFSQERHDQLREINARYSELLGNIDLEILKTDQLRKVQEIANEVTEESIAVQLKKAELAKTIADEEERLAGLVESGEEDTFVMIETGNNGNQIPESFAADFAPDGKLFGSDNNQFEFVDARADYLEKIALQKEELAELELIHQQKIEVEADANDILLHNGISYRQSVRTGFLTELEDFRTKNGSKQKLIIENAKIELEDMIRAQEILEQKTSNAANAAIRELEIEESKAGNILLIGDFKVNSTNEYTDLTTKSMDNANKQQKKFVKEFEGDAGKINVKISEMRKFVSNLTQILEKSGKTYGRSALSGFRLQKTKDRLKELLKVQLSYINDNFEADLQANENSFKAKQKKYEREEELIVTNLNSIQQIQKKGKRKQIIADIKANRNNYDVLKNLDEKEFTRLITKKKANSKELDNLLDLMLAEEVSKQETNEQLLVEIVKEFENKKKKIKIAERAEMGQFERERVRQGVDLLETDLSNLKSNQKKRMDLMQGDHDEQERADQELLDLGEMREIEFNNRKRARAAEMKSQEQTDRDEQLQKFSEMYSGMADVVMAVSANIAQGNMARIEEEHTKRTEDLNNQFENELAIAEEAGGDTEAMKRAHDNKMEALELQKEEKIRIIKRRQFNLEKANNIAMALINGAQAIAKVTSQTGVGAIIAAPITSALIAAQIAAIMAQRFTGAKGGIIPGGDDKFAQGGMVVGPSHANGGVKFAVGGRVSELEGGEAVINKRSTAMFHGQLSAMNQAGGGKKFAVGGITPGTRAALNGAKGNFSAGDIAELISSSINSQQVYVSESEISSTQSNVGITESLSNLF